MRGASRAALAMRQVCARQPATTGESSSTMPRAICGRLLAASRLTIPPSEWPTRYAGSLTCAAMNSSNWSRRCGQLFVTGKRGSWP
jgi:hypothetical protein